MEQAAQTDKARTCKGCEDRAPECHDTCAEYQKRKKRQKEINERRRSEQEKRNWVAELAHKSVERKRRKGRKG